mmetsp:Transcript_23062/g.60248  ORF Transcript_23062/g.60248 Transcript_23062/m.60248 type:complete len:243 (-) Transcript_23062:454-1182(-)
MRSLPHHLLKSFDNLGFVLKKWHNEPISISNVSHHVACVHHVASVGHKAWPARCLIQWDRPRGGSPPVLAIILIDIVVPRARLIHDDCAPALAGMPEEHVHHSTRLGAVLKDPCVFAQQYCLLWLAPPLKPRKWVHCQSRRYVFVLEIDRHLGQPLRPGCCLFVRRFHLDGQPGRDGNTVATEAGLEDLGFGGRREHPGPQHRQVVHGVGRAVDGLPEHRRQLALCKEEALGFLGGLRHLRV